MYLSSLLLQHAESGGGAEDTSEAVSGLQRHHQNKSRGEHGKGLLKVVTFSTECFDYLTHSIAKGFWKMSRFNSELLKHMATCSASCKDSVHASAFPWIRWKHSLSFLFWHVFTWGIWGLQLLRSIVTKHRFGWPAAVRLASLDGWGEAARETEIIAGVKKQTIKFR